MEQCFVDWCAYKLVLQLGRFLPISCEFERVSDRTTAGRAVSGTCWLPGVAVSAKNEGGPHSPAFGSPENIKSHQLPPVISLKCPLQRSELLSGCVFIYRDLLKFAPNQHPLTPQPCRTIVTPRWFFATKFHSASVWNLPQKFPLIFLTSLSLQPREVQREKKHALTTAQYVFPTCCAGPVPLGQEANARKFC